LFDWSIDFSPKAQLTKDRVANITQWLTRKVYRYINRGIFEKDKIMFKLMMCLKILIKDGKLTNADVNVFLKAGGGIDDKQKLVSWLDPKQWLNLKAISIHSFGNERSKFFGSVIERMKNETKSDDPWRSWFNANDPENVPVPDL
jgi:dynein heavy chain